MFPTKGETNWKWFFKPIFLPKKRTYKYDFTSLVDLGSFNFWKKVKTPERLFKYNWTMSVVHVLLVSLFGRPIVRSISHFLVDQFFFLVDQKPISHFFGRPIFFLPTKNHFLMFLVDQFFFWSTKFIFGQPKKNWSTKKNEK